MILINGKIIERGDWDELQMGSVIRMKNIDELKEVLDGDGECKECGLFLPMEAFAGEKLMVKSYVQSRRRALTAKFGKTWAICEHMAEVIK